MKFFKIASALAASALMAAPVVAQAGTRAEAAKSYPAGSYSASRASTSVKSENDLRPAIWVIVLLSGGAAAYGLSRAFDNGSNGAN